MGYLGEVGIGSQELAEALYTKVALGIDPIHIAVVPVDNYGKPHSPSAWKMTNARLSWSWNGHNGESTSTGSFKTGLVQRSLVDWPCSVKVPLSHRNIQPALTLTFI